MQRPVLVQRDNQPERDHGKRADLDSITDIGSATRPARRRPACAEIFMYA